MKIKKPDASPYGTLENRIDGVVITFSNVTAAKTVAAQLWQPQSEMKMGMKKGPP